MNRRTRALLAELKAKKLDAETRCGHWLANGNEAAEARKLEKAEMCYRKAQYWLNRANKLQDQIDDCARGMNRRTRTLLAVQYALIGLSLAGAVALAILPALAGHTRTDAPCFVNVHGTRVCVTQPARCSTDSECERLGE